MCVCWCVFACECKSLYVQFVLEHVTCWREVFLFFWQRSSKDRHTESVHGAHEGDDAVHADVRKAPEGDSSVMGRRRPARPSLPLPFPLSGSLSLSPSPSVLLLLLANFIGNEAVLPRLEVGLVEAVPSVDHLLVLRGPLAIVLPAATARLITVRVLQDLGDVHLLL